MKPSERRRMIGAMLNHYRNWHGLKGADKDSIPMKIKSFYADLYDNVINGDDRMYWPEDLPKEES